MAKVKRTPSPFLFLIAVVVILILLRWIFSYLGYGQTTPGGFNRWMGW